MHYGKSHACTPRLTWSKHINQNRGPSMLLAHPLKTKLRPCAGINKNKSHRLTYLNTWSPGRWCCLGRIRMCELIEQDVSRGAGFAVWKAMHHDHCSLYLLFVTGDVRCISCSSDTNHLLHPLHHHAWTITLWNWMFRINFSFYKLPWSWWFIIVIAKQLIYIQLKTFPNKNWVLE